jgi:hypothetical protein
VIKISINQTRSQKYPLTVDNLSPGKVYEREGGEIYIFLGTFTARMYLRIFNVAGERCWVLLGAHDMHYLSGFREVDARLEVDL